MANKGPVRWLASKAKDGLTELPRNTSWVLSKALADSGAAANSASSTAGSAVDGARDGARKARVAVADTVPFGMDSLELRIKRAQDGLDRA